MSALSLLTENLLTVPQVTEEIEAATGRRPNRATVHRWMTRGVGGYKLESVRIGRSIFSSRESLTRFIERLNSTA